MNSNTIIITVPPEADGTRADIFLANFTKDILSRSAAQKILTINGIGKNLRVKAGEVFSLEIPAPAPQKAEPEEIPLNIVYEDDDLLVVDKPSGLVVHPAAGHSSGTLVNGLVFHCNLSGIGGESRPGIVHRLDKDTSGLMIVAKNDAAHIAISEQFERNELYREYNALCLGVLQQDRLRIDSPIGRHPRDRKKMAVSPPRARTAVTYIEVLERFKSHTLVSARLETGRTHQIRVHLAHIGHPVLGDPTYGAARQSLSRFGQILHAVKVKFIHPSSGEEVAFNSPLPEYFLEALQKVKS
ncbi:MAG: RluA family pseudouridine synthase [Defluviitaleaceae bacterium]|nr:RluA family pseudouridine synthase [Defluviitaleaceae bacterium]